jgi:hypothetical protein
MDAKNRKTPVRPPLDLTSILVVASLKLTLEIRLRHRSAYRM